MATTEAAAQPEAPAQTTARTAAAAESPARPADPTTTASPLSGTAVAGASGRLGPPGWLLLFLVAAGVVGGVLVRRSRRNADWVADADTLMADTRAVIGARLPLALATITAAQRALSWPPVRADLIDLLARWAVLPENARGNQRADWSRQVWGLLEEVVTAVDAEYEELVAGRQWRPLRLRVDDASRALVAALSRGQGAGPHAPLV